MKNTIETFLSRIKKTKSCWLWMGSMHGANSGYGEFPFENKVVRSHRFSYELFKGKIPDGLHIDHLCRVRHCVNPDHLEAVPQGVNTLRGFAPSAIYARRTKCKYGHKYNEINTRYMLQKNGKPRRICRPCHARRMNHYNAIKRASESKP